MNGINKIIGIGLPKTGTSSLAVSLSNNNVPTIHFGSPECEEVAQKMYRGIYKFDIFKKYKGITNAFEVVFPQVDKEYPNSKFIYTVRDKDIWLTSIENHWIKALNDKKVDLMVMHHHLMTFGTYLFNRDRFSFVYDMHCDMVKNYFKDRKSDILTIDITNDVKYVYKICDFLNIEVVDGTAFHLNKGKN